MKKMSTNSMRNITGGGGCYCWNCGKTIPWYTYMFKHGFGRWCKAPQ